MPALLPLLQLAYASEPVKRPSAAYLENLLNRSRARNSVDEITGLLLFGSNTFIQILEGTPAGVQAAFERISADPHHKNVYILSRAQVARRDFDGWAMAYSCTCPPHVDESAQSAFKDLLSCELDELSSEEASEPIRRLVRNYAKLVGRPSTPSPHLHGRRKSKEQLSSDSDDDGE